jgi:hypothetical protein
MNRKLIATCGAALVLTTLLWTPATAHRDERALAGTWNLTVTPQPNPDVAVVPPPFQAFFAFELAGTLNETDTLWNPRSAIVLLPELGPLSAGDGIGAWEVASGDRYRGRFIKLLVDESGEHLGYLINNFELSLRGANRLVGNTDTSIVLGTDLDAEPVFTGGLTRFTGVRLGSR